MKRIGIFYGSTTGTTEAIARKIANMLNVAESDIHNASHIKESLIKEYGVLLLGSSTWGDGDLQDDWYEGMRKLAGMNLAGITVALFGCGDSVSYSDTFCDAIGIMYEDLKATGCHFCGAVPTEGYKFDHSKAVVDGKFVGLPIDDMNEEEKTNQRVNQWVELLKNECLN